MVSIAPYLALITAVIAGYLAFRHQQRLKAFELFYGRRSAVLEDIETELEKVHELQEALATGSDAKVREFEFRAFHNGLVLHHKVRGANFGEVANTMGATYYALLTEALSRKDSYDPTDWLARMANTLAALHGFAHSALSYEIEMLTLPWYRRLGAWVRRTREVRKERRPDPTRVRTRVDRPAPNHAPAPDGSAAGEGQ